MINNRKYIAALMAITLFFSCSGGSDNSSDTDTVASPGPVSEMDRSRYNLNEPDEMLHEMQDSVGMGTDTSGLPADKNKIDSLID
ncbi:hypothetical protein FXV77_21295 [Sphingobacterium phlebotomi]|uniref:Uncharacterized protein n=1 Tax=Sphingobacterium phlebotomi TaxID=2605433 RepID=A0A5D4GTJ1_9SPHI|nr:hypothetical protein [Sphingobacterium phlebotomi]TYR31233.1 hypothetical protein FXV77_21295 [Sphingobacterium phlebotomi]